MPPKIVDREEMQNGILDAAMQVYVEKGYHVATIADVATSAGVAKGTLYLYFKNKEAIAIAMVDRHFKALEERFLDVSTPETLESFANNLSETMNIPEAHARFIPVFFEVFGPSFSSEAFSKRVAGFFDTLGRHYAAQIKSLQQAGQLRKNADPNRLGRVLASMIDGVILHRGLFRITKAKYTDMRKEAVQLFVLGLAPD